MKKVLAAIRRNGVEVATLFDQNHIDNHKNSMAGQTVLMELAQGDRVQVRQTHSRLDTQDCHFRFTCTHSLVSMISLAII